MAKYRGFNSVLEHDNLIIENWNKTISKRDVVYILGDVTMETKKPYHILNKLNGIKKVVGGNHDLPQHVPELLKYVHSFCAMFKYKGFILTHCPVHESEINRFRKNIHGHVHGLSLPDSRYVNVSCEAVNYTPILISSINNKDE